MSEVLCGVCNSEPKKYKCPTCALPYCSLSCFKVHKSTHAEAAPPPAAPVEPEIPQPPPPAPIPCYLKKKTDFSILATNPKFQELLKAYPVLLPTLQRVYAATIEPDEDDQRRCYKSGRGGFRGRGGRGWGGRGRGRGGRRDDAPHKWTQKQGDADGMKMLKEYRGREDNDKEKEAMATFVQLVEDTFADPET
ncbi:hypothetical protein BU25DRAFT_163130 [Macroventuria anomochaeta]|uniref:Uncharacterized protein n=1 Tax=Macroventuria anomochaeta TaxID=301207 RepID=A0ACB6RST1_9PLEO|nr:uncharacterized protein BU25DRAFT_163130 [Macroventuria anomochaeta]KAF2624194.1 hypothetical protein BU25DRAFT_163130 [Macroventuria anomochaeta]